MHLAKVQGDHGSVMSLAKDTICGRLERRGTRMC